MSLVYLLDTNTISEPLKAIPNKQVIENIERYHAQIAIAAFVVYELVRGVALLPDSKKRLKTNDYLESVLVKFPILPIPKQLQNGRVKQPHICSNSVKHRLLSMPKSQRLQKQTT